MYRLSNFYMLASASLAVAVRRRLNGPRHPAWSQDVETVITFLKKQTRAAYQLADIRDGREYTDALVFHSAELDRCQVENIHQPVRGSWYTPETAQPDRTLLYLHGGGYVHYARGLHQLIAQVALSTRARTFALDYRLAPEHPYPAALEDALAAYQWLLDQGIPPSRLVVAGDSAGGHLAISLLQALREQHLPLPALGLLLCPWVDVQNRGDSMQRSAELDYIDKPILDRWGQWFYQDQDPNAACISLMESDLSGLPSLYVQCGEAEVLYDMICDFVEQARRQRADVRLDCFPAMVHDFQVFGSATLQSREALARLGQAVDNCLGNL